MYVLREFGESLVRQELQADLQDFSRNLGVQLTTPQRRSHHTHFGTMLREEALSRRCGTREIPRDNDLATFPRKKQKVLRYKTSIKAIPQQHLAVLIFNQAARYLPPNFPSRPAAMSQSIPPPLQFDLRLDRLSTELRYIIIEHLFDSCYEDFIIHIRSFPVTPPPWRQLMRFASSQRHGAFRALAALGEASDVLRKDMLNLIPSREVKVIRLRRPLLSRGLMVHRRYFYETIFCMSISQVYQSQRGSGNRWRDCRISRRTFDLMALVGLLLAMVVLYVMKAR